MKEIYPIWSETFRDLPRIPASKLWLDNHMTYEQIIIHKLIDNQSISQKDERYLIKAIDFYKVALPELQRLELQSFKFVELEELKNYFHYVFNYIVLMSNNLHVFNLVRLVENESVLGQKKRIVEQRFLSYPPMEVVRKQNRYNRANTPNYNLFYATNSIDYALLELKPKSGSLVTVGLWKPKFSKEIKIVTYPVSHNSSALQVNPAIQKGFNTFQELKKKQHPLLSQFMETMLRFFSDEFAKPVTHHQQYFYSALLSEQLFTVKDANPNFNINCIIYPSVGNQLRIDNLAIKPDFIDQNFHLYKVIEFEITQPHYELNPIMIDQEQITVVNYKDIHFTNKISEDGHIFW